MKSTLTICATLCALLAGAFGSACGSHSRTSALGNSKAPVPGDGQAGASIATPAPSAMPSENSAMVQVRLFDASGLLIGPISVPKVVKTDAEWRKQLTSEQFQIARGAGTERPFCGTLLDNKKEGVYACVCCALPLFQSNAKFHSGTGWPSFFQPISKENVRNVRDDSHGMVRVEILCERCDAHLGHVFDDGPDPTGLRYCVNSESLRFVDASELKSLADPLAAAATGSKTNSSANQASAAGAANAGSPQASLVIAGGCFWCVEAVFEELEGVSEAISGYAGGTAETANYKAVCSGTTDHAEAVQVLYDPSKIRFEELLAVHFATHDPTTLNRQGADEGPQYRSAIFYANQEEQELAKAVIDDLTEAKAFSKPIVTTLEPLTNFYPAETYHQNYVCENPMQGYVRGVALPKVEKVRAKFADKLKATSPLKR